MTTKQTESIVDIICGGSRHSGRQLPSIISLSL